MFRRNIMKYIKYFENYEDHFIKVDSFSPSIFRPTTNKEFDEEEVDKIRGFVDSNSDTLHLYKNPKGNDLQILNFGKNKCTIYKLSDEWYYLFKWIGNDEVEAYKCDQVEGVLKCIEINIL